MKTIDMRSYFRKEGTVPDEHISLLIECINQLTSITTESFYVLDILRNQLCYIKPNDLFLKGYSMEDVMREGVDFYSKIVYPEDLSLCAEMWKSVLRYLKDFKEKKDEIDYFSCAFRLQCSFSFINRPLPQMVFFRMVPIEVNDEFHYLICMAGSSTVKEAGDLRIYNKDGLAYETYNFRTKRWKQIMRVSLTEREEAILMLAGQGKSVKEIADDLYKGHHTIRNQIKQLFSKLKVHSMQEAIELACYHRITYPKPNKETQPIETSCKRSRVILTEDMFQRIQQYLNEGKSIRYAARLEGVAESAIRYWKGKERLEK